MTIYATVDDVVSGFDGAVDKNRYDFIDEMIARAHRKLVSEVGDVAVLIAGGRTTALCVRDVICNMVTRVARNPDGVRTQTAGPFSYTTDPQVAAGRLYLTREDRKLLGTVSGPQTLTVQDPALEHITWHPRRFPPLEQVP